MESVLSWLNQPLLPESGIRLWMAIGAGLVLLAAILVGSILRRRARRRRKVPEPVTLEPQKQPVLELANLQGIGMRTEQQDAFGMSPLDRYEENGLLAVLCDGMGGMAAGGAIAAETVAGLLGFFPWQDDGQALQWIWQQSRRVYDRFRGRGGTTLVATLLRGERLWFCCAGDSDLFLLRQGELYALHIPQEYRYELALHALEGDSSLEAAFLDPQAGALTEYIGKAEVTCQHTRIPLRLEKEDTLLLCSDGVSDTLTRKQLREALALPPQAACDRLEEDILAAGLPNQDNYTAIILRYHGEGENT